MGKEAEEGGGTAEEEGERLQKSVYMLLYGLRAYY